MTEDEMNDDFESAEEQDGAAVAEEAVTPTETVEENTTASVPADDFFGEDDGFELPNPDHVITVLTSSGGRSYVPATEAMSVNDVIAHSGLNVMHGAEFYLNGSIIKAEDLVPAGQTLQIVGTVKGGVL